MVVASALKVEQHFFFFLSLTIGTSKLIEAQMGLPRLLFGIGFQIFIVTPQMFRFSRKYVENVIALYIAHYGRFS